MAGFALGKQQFAALESLAHGARSQCAQFLRRETGEQRRAFEDGNEIKALSAHPWILSGGESAYRYGYGAGSIKRNFLNIRRTCSGVILRADPPNALRADPSNAPSPTAQ
jgi:hypothetical protein